MSAPLRRSWAPVVLAYAAFVLVGVSAGVGGVLLPAQIEDYGIDRARIGITFFTFSGGFLLAGSTTGALMHRLGTRSALVVGTGAYLVAGLYLAVRPPFVALVVVQLLAGYGTGILESVLNAYLAGLPGATTLLNRLHAFFGVGALLGPPLAAWLLTWRPWTSVYLVLALACLPLFAGFIAAYPSRAVGSGDPSRAVRSGDPDRPAATDRPADRTGRGLLPATLRVPAVVLGAVFLSIYVGLEISIGNWGYSFLVEERGQHGLIAGYTVSGYWMGLTLGRFLISPLAERIGLTDVGMAAGCLVGVVACAVLTWVAPLPAVAVVGFVLLGFFLGPLFPTTMAVAPRLAENRLVPTAIGVMNGVSVIGGSALPWLAGVLGQGAGLWTLLPFTVTLAVLQLAIWWRMARHMTTARLPRPDGGVVATG